MKSKSLASLITMAALAAAATLVSNVALAVDTAALDTQVSATLDKFYALNPKHKDLVQNAAAVLVFPDITKGGIGVGGEHGDGALQQDGKTVGYYSISGASIGLTLGLSHHSEVIVFKTTDARDKFLKSGNWSIGADASVAVVKEGAGGGLDSQTMNKPVDAFIFGERGLMGDASLQGAKISKIAQ
jgi:lipid-binding SYLF domain-containing protein